MAREMHRSVDEVGAVVAEAGIDCGFHKGGAIYFAVERRPAAPRPGSTTRELVALRPRRRLDAARRGRSRRRSSHAPGIRGATVHPARRDGAPGPARAGLAREVERLGGVDPRADRRAVDRAAASCAPTAARCEPTSSCWPPRRTRARIDGHERDDAAARQLRDRHRADRRRHLGVDRPRRTGSCSSAAPNMLGYGQRTADGRIVWGGLGAPYRWNMGIPPSPMHATAGSPTRLQRTTRRACSRPSRHRRHPPLGRRARRAARPAARASATTGPRASRGAAATPARAWRPPTPPGGRSPTSSAASTATSCTCRGSATGPAPGSRNHGRGSECTRHSLLRTPPTGSTALRSRVSRAPGGQTDSAVIGENQVVFQLGQRRQARWGSGSAAPVEVSIQHWFSRHPRHAGASAHSARSSRVGWSNSTSRHVRTSAPRYRDQQMM